MRAELDFLQDPRLQAHLGTLRGRVSPTGVALAQRIAASIDWRALGSPEHPEWTGRLYQHITTRIAGSYRLPGSGSDGDILALAFIVVMEATKSMQEDLKTIMAGVKGINSARDKMRDLLLVMVAKEEGRAVEWPPH